MAEAETARRFPDLSPDSLRFSRSTDQIEGVLARSIDRVLRAVNAMQPVPTTAKLWDDGFRLLPIPQRSDALSRFAYAKVIRDLPEPVLRPVLAAYSLRLRSLLPNHSKVVRSCVEGWIADLWAGLEASFWGWHSAAAAQHRYRWLPDNPPLEAIIRGLDGGSYPEARGYQAPSERRLEQIVFDENEPEARRAGALAELDKIMEKRLLDQATKTELSYDDPEAPSDVKVAFGDYPSVEKLGGASRRRPCTKHGIRACSECSQRRPGGQKQIATSDLVLRFEQLAQQSGWEPVVLKAAPRPGNPTPAEAARLDELGQIIVVLTRRERHTLEAVAAELGCSKQRVSALRKRVERNPDKTPNV
jgi:hypothetical protein